MKMRKVTQYLHPWQAESSNIQKPWKEIKSGLAHSHTHTQAMLLFTKPLARGWKLTVSSMEQKRKWPQSGATWCKKPGSDADKRFSWVTSASVVNGGLVLRGCPACVFLIFSITQRVWGCPLRSQSFVRVYSNAWGKPSVKNWAVAFNEQRRNLLVSKVNRYTRFWVWLNLAGSLIDNNGDRDLYKWEIIIRSGTLLITGIEGSGCSRLIKK